MITPAQLAVLYDVPPIEATFVGGVAHGRSMFVPDDRDSYVMPVSSPVRVGEPGHEIPEIAFDLYRRIMVRDDGVRVYRHCPAESRR
jgi:hypothetical protein